MPVSKSAPTSKQQAATMRYVGGIMCSDAAMVGMGGEVRDTKMGLVAIGWICMYLTN